MPTQTYIAFASALHRSYLSLATAELLKPKPDFDKFNLYVRLCNTIHDTLAAPRCKPPEPTESALLVHETKNKQTK
jgi:hypothetical protein